MYFITWCLVQELCGNDQWKKTNTVLNDVIVYNMISHKGRAGQCRVKEELGKGVPFAQGAAEVKGLRHTTEDWNFIKQNNKSNILLLSPFYRQGNWDRSF